MKDEALTPGDPTRRGLGATLLVASATMAGFVVFAVVTTQLRGVRAQSPWQDDPYDGVVSLTMFCVPVVLALVLLRVQLCRGDELLPLVRAHGLLRASGFGLVLVLPTVALDVLAWVLGARRADWAGGTVILATTAVALTVCASAALVLVVRLLRRMPPVEADDWSQELVPLADLAARRVRPLLWWAPALARTLETHVLGGRYGVRRHPVAWSVLAAEIGAAGIVAGLVLGEGTPLTFIGPLGALVCGSGFLVVVYAANRALGLARVTPGRPGLRALGLGAALGLDVAFTLRDQLWQLLHLGSAVASVSAIYVVMLGGALLGAALASGRRALVSG